jgi:putative transposase
LNKKSDRNMFSLSRIGQAFQYLPRAAFDRIVERHKANRYVKRFGSWDLLVSMVYAQLSGVRSLRELEIGFNQHRNHHYHLATGRVSRSTLAEANARRNPEVFADLVRLLVQQAGRSLRKERQEMLYLLDSTSIALRGRGSQWTKSSATRTPGLKMHVLFAKGQQLPVYQSITAANVNDVDEGRRLAIEPGATYVFDKGYCDYGWWRRIDAQGARFVTRLKKNAAVRILCSRAIDAQDQQVLSDSDVSFVWRSNRGGHRNLYEQTLRRIEVARPGDEPLVLVTNDLHSPASQIAGLYKERWQIELFFKWIKQNLKIKRFLGESENAVRIQLLTALVAYLLVILMNAANGCTRKLKEVLDELRTGLFQRPQQELSRWRRRRREQELLQALQPGLFR